MGALIEMNEIIRARVLGNILGNRSSLYNLYISMLNRIRLYLFRIDLNDNKKNIKLCENLMDYGSDRKQENIYLESI